MKDKVFVVLFLLFIIFVTIISFRALWAVDQYAREMESFSQRVKVVENRIIEQITPRVKNNEVRILTHQTDDHVTHKDMNLLLKELSVVRDIELGSDP